MKLLCLLKPCQLRICGLNAKELRLNRRQLCQEVAKSLNLVYAVKIKKLNFSRAWQKTNNTNLWDLCLLIRSEAKMSSHMSSISGLGVSHSPQRSPTCSKPTNLCQPKNDTRSQQKKTKYWGRSLWATREEKDTICPSTIMIKSSFD